MVAYASAKRGLFFTLTLLSLGGVANAEQHPSQVTIVPRQPHGHHAHQPRPGAPLVVWAAADPNPEPAPAQQPIPISPAAPNPLPAANPQTNLFHLERLALMANHLVLQLGRAQSALILIEQATSYIADEGGAPKMKHILLNQKGEARGIESELQTLYPFSGHANWVYRSARANVAYAKGNQLPDWPQLNDRLPGTTESVTPLRGMHAKFVAAVTKYFPIVESAILANPGFNPENVRANIAQLKPTLTIIEQLITDMNEIYVKENLNHRPTYDLAKWGTYLFYTGVK